MNPEDAPQTRSLVREVLSRGYWYTTYEIQGFLQIAGHRLLSESACSARVRDLRKSRYGKYNVVSRPRAGCTAWEYRIEAEQEKAA